MLTLFGADVIRNYADKVQYLYIFRKYIVVATSMQKISTVALSVQKLGWGGNFHPPPIPLAYIKKPIPNRVNNFLSTTDNYFPTVLTFWRHFAITSFCVGFFDFLRIMSILAHYSGCNICHVIKTDKDVNLHCLTFQNLQSELKYQDYSSTICILKRTRFLSRKCRKLGFSDDVIRNIVTWEKCFLHRQLILYQVSLL